eukprot:3120457-Amphidinium_carterae.1
MPGKFAHASQPCPLHERKPCEWWYPRSAAAATPRDRLWGPQRSAKLASEMNANLSVRKFQFLEQWESMKFDGNSIFFD